MPNEEYNEAWEECSKHYLTTHIPIKKVTSSFDKFFDKIKTLKSILFSVHNHFRKDIDIDGVPMLELGHRRQNMELILLMIDNLVKIEKGVKNGKTEESKDTSNEPGS